MDLIAKAVTLKSIKLNDPTAKNLLFSAKHSVLYTFDPQSSGWEKTETEGCLAIYKRAKLLKSLPSVHVLFILNRLRPENFSCPLAEIESVQLEGDLLMLLLKNNKVMGIWLFDEKERQLALNVLQSKLNGAAEDAGEGGKVEEVVDVNDDDDDVVLSNDSHDTRTLHDTPTQTQLKPISVTDLLGSNDNKSSPSILDILSKAKRSTSTATSTATSTSAPSSNSLDTFIVDEFKDLPSTTSLKSFTNSVCHFLQENPQLLASLHRQLTINK